MRAAPGTEADVEGAYNNIFSTGLGTGYSRTKRTSLVTDPPNGRLPPVTAEAEARRAAEAREAAAARANSAPRRRADVSRGVPVQAPPSAAPGRPQNSEPQQNEAKRGDQPMPDEPLANEQRDAQ